MPATRFADDTLLVSYPRSGNTWVRFLLGNLISPVVTFATLEDAIPDVYVNTDEELLTHRRPRILKSHEPFDDRYGRVIYIVRDPRDIVVSYYYYHLKGRFIDESLPLDDYVGGFVTGKWDTFGSWAEHVDGWLDAREGNPDFLLLRYEALIEDAAAQLMSVADFLDVSAPSQRIDDAIRLSSLPRMKELEQEEAHLWRPLVPMRRDIPFIDARGSSNERVALTPAMRNMIGSAWSATLARVGYRADQ